MLRAFEMDPESAGPMTAAELPEGPLLGQPGFYEGPTWVRVAKEGEWAIGIEDRIAKAFLENIVARVSLGTESAAVSWTTRGDATVMYRRDGSHISTFSTSTRDPRYTTTGTPDSGTGSEPHYFDEALAARGFAESDAAKVSDLPLPERMVVLLGIVSEIFGIRLSQETYNSPLLTAHRTTPYRYEPWRNPGPTEQVSTVTEQRPDSVLGLGLGLCLRGRPNGWPIRQRPPVGGPLRGLALNLGQTLKIPRRGRVLRSSRPAGSGGSGGRPVPGPHFRAGDF